MCSSFFICKGASKKLRRNLPFNTHTFLYSRKKNIAWQQTSQNANIISRIYRVPSSAKALFDLWLIYVFCVCVLECAISCCHFITLSLLYCSIITDPSIVGWRTALRFGWLYTLRLIWKPNQPRTLTGSLTLYGALTRANNDNNVVSKSVPSAMTFMQLSSFGVLNATNAFAQHLRVFRSQKLPCDVWRRHSTLSCLNRVQYQLAMYTIITHIGQHETTSTRWLRPTKSNESYAKYDLLLSRFANSVFFYGWKTPLEFVRAVCEHWLINKQVWRLDWCLRSTIIEFILMEMPRANFLGGKTWNWFKTLANLERHLLKIFRIYPSQNCGCALKMYCRFYGITCWDNRCRLAGGFLRNRIGPPWFVIA